ncbi:uncharacterized protein LOC121372133 [Gigantopelta aegis]|uniref:uncharacterized protein LOC121372133 n=1 Tax=Gigantopelta aegis TaxID=1735272 RepID=UPI001B8882EE|nr:uncharacterized protein LOC121372133 [Gigantopelta aegis]XP_041354333.1 uncharacterized protein LOC121372133 [Gigantopelta aegis]
MATAAFSSTSSTETPSNSTPESFKFETKYIVLSFLSELTKRQKQHNSASPPKAFQTSSTDSDQRTRKFFNTWRGKHSPYKRKNKKSANAEFQNRKKTGHGALRKTSSHNLLCGSTDVSQKARLARKYSLPTSCSYSDHRLTSSVSTPGMLNRSLSSGSCHDCNSYCSDADDELESSQGSSVVGSSLGIYKHSHREHFQHLSTVASESETEQELSKILSKAEPIDIDMITLEERLLFRSKSGQSNESASGLNSTFLDDIDGVIPNSFDHIESNTDSDLSDLELELEEELGAKGGEGDNASIGIEVAVLPNGSNGVVDRSCLRLDLVGDTADRHPIRLDSIVLTLQEEVQEQMIFLESEVEDAIKSQLIQRVDSPFECPLTPQSECARLLAVIGDDIDVQHRARIQSAVGLFFNSSSGVFSYDTFRNIASDVVDETLPGWRQVAILLMYTEGVAIRLVHSGHHNIACIVDYSVQLLTDLAADFIIKQGGWGAIMNCDPSLTGTTSQSSPERSQPDNPFLVAMLKQQQAEDHVRRQCKNECNTLRQTTDGHGSRSEDIRPTCNMSEDVRPSCSYDYHSTSPVSPVSQEKNQADEDQASDRPREITPVNARSEFLRSVANGSSWILNRLLDTGQRLGVSAQISASFLLLAAGITFTVTYFKGRSGQ